MNSSHYVVPCDVRTAHTFHPPQPRKIMSSRGFHIVFHKIKENTVHIQRVPTTSTTLFVATLSLGHSTRRYSR